MPIMGDIRVRVDDFLTDTRLRICMAVQCRFNTANHPDGGSPVCRLKGVSLGEDGRCESFEEGTPLA